MNTAKRKNFSLIIFEKFWTFFLRSSYNFISLSIFYNESVFHYKWKKKCFWHWMSNFVLKTKTCLAHFKCKNFHLNKILLIYFKIFHKILDGTWLFLDEWLYCPSWPVPAKPLLFYRVFFFLIWLVSNDFCFVYVLVMGNISLWTVFLAF